MGLDRWPFKTELGLQTALTMHQAKKIETGNGVGLFSLFWRKGSGNERKNRKDIGWRMLTTIRSDGIMPLETIRWDGERMDTDAHGYLDRQAG